MPLKILLSSTLRTYLYDYDTLKGIDFAVDGEITVAELCRWFNIPAEKVKIIMVNGRGVSLDYILKGDERVGLFPPVGGG